MVDSVNAAARSQIMSRIRCRDTKLEVAGLKLLEGAFGRMDRHPKGVPGNPDAVLRDGKTAFFVDGCFWHGCKDHCSIPESNKGFWVAKFRRNVKRDREIDRALVAAGWTVVRLWGHELRSGSPRARVLGRFLNKWRVINAESSSARFGGLSMNDGRRDAL